LAHEPHIVELSQPPSPVEAFRRLAHAPHCLFLDSALRWDDLGRYSFLAVDPFAFLHVATDGRDALEQFARQLSSYAVATIAGLPPFQGGAAGLLAYDLNRQLEKLPRPAHDDFQTPALAVGLYDVVLAYDHQVEKAWIVSHGFPATAGDDRRRRAARRADWLAQLLDVATPPPLAATTDPLSARHISTPQFDTNGPAGLTSNFTADGYRRAVRRAVDYVYAGDIFQVNLSQRLLFPAADDSVELYLRLRSRNPATFAGYFDLGAAQIVSASPERFLRVRSDGRVETRPIKGTRPRTDAPEADIFAAADLQASEKDRAENVMIVDLLRNDLSRACAPDSVRVTQLCELEVYRFVQHLVSVIEGRLAADRTPLDLVRASFPGGSITGAPKIRAMEIIAELEQTARGAYCGSLGYVGFNGAVDLSILIRTITASRGWWQMPVGGGIVAQSDPQSEYEETWHKAAGLIHSLQ
jgi:para-aminobenzoate synthetase component 1